MGWAIDELSEINLGDERLNKRASSLLECLGSKPSASLQGACNGWSETLASYRFLSNDAVTPIALLQPHVIASQNRMQYYPVVLCLADTTELDFNGQNIQGLGPLSYEAQRGMYLHPVYAVTPEREPLGVLDIQIWARKKTKAARAKEPSESLRWREGYEQLAEIAKSLPSTRLVYIADRESDIFDLMWTAQELSNPVDWLIRSKTNRILEDGEKLWDRVLEGQPIGEIQFTMPSRHGVKAREVKQEIFVKRVMLGKDASKVEATCLIAREIDPPEGVTPIEWRLLTNRQIASLEDAIEIINWYRARWEIEIFFNVLKNACRVESLQLSTMRRLENAVVLFMVVSWRICHLMRTGRTTPELPADLFFDEIEWKGAYILFKKKPPKDPPSVGEVVRLIAMLGGFLGRKGDGDPGVKTLWIGLQRITDFSAGVFCMKELLASEGTEKSSLKKEFRVPSRKRCV